MGRVIKFRAWDKQKMAMIYADNETIFFGLTRGIFEPMQFTGLHDKNGQEIYEGDIMKIESEKHMVVGWSKKFASFILDRNGWAFSHWFGESCNPEDCEIVGNIHENPELLNATKS